MTGKVSVVTENVTFDTTRLESEVVWIAKNALTILKDEEFYKGWTEGPVVWENEKRGGSSAEWESTRWITC